jgi:hypothetical protein
VSIKVTVTSLPASGSLGRFVALSADSTWLQSGATVNSGDVGAALRRQRAHGHGADFDDGDNDDVTMRVDQGATMAQAGSRVVGDTVVLMGQSSVYDVIDNFLLRKRGSMILGTTMSPMAVPYVAMPAFPTVAPGNKNVTVAKNQTLTLVAGNYGTVHVSTGAKLILAGLYQMASLDVDQSATIVFHAATQIRIKTQLDTDAKSKLILDPAVTGLKASQMVIYVQGADKDCRHLRADDNGDDPGSVTVDIGTQNVVQANIYAANGTVWLNSKTQATGAFIGQHVRIGQGVTLTLSSAFGG